jgi:hypothetical protein
MKLTRRTLLLAAAAAPLAACATGATLAPHGAYQAGAISLTLSRDWSDMTRMLPNPHPAGMHMLTVNGPFLDRLYAMTLEPGEAMFPPRDRNAPRVAFRADMTDTELVEFVTDSFAQAFESPESQALRPQNMGSTAGVRFDIATRTQEGLLFTGTALVARANGKFNGLIYLAPTEHYYAELLPDAESILTSARLT